MELTRNRVNEKLTLFTNVNRKNRVSTKASTAMLLSTDHLIGVVVGAATYWGSRLFHHLVNRVYFLQHVLGLWIISTPSFNSSRWE
jgi:hypothetical protein